jgi:glycosyltransferase involved in cell wall biosynthesis
VYCRVGRILGPMIVGIDGRSLGRGQAGRGVAHYTASLVAALARGFPDDTWRLLVPGGSGAAPAGAELRASRVPRRPAFALGAVAGLPRLDRMAGPSDVTWLPAPAPAGVSRGARFVLTLHDLSFVDRPGDYTPYERAWHRLGRFDALARRATHVMAVSEATRAAAIEAWGLDPARVSVVAPGVTAPASPPAPPDGVPEPYLLFVGALEPRKGPDVLARAYARARRAGLRAALVVVGEGRAPLRGEGVHHLGTVADRATLESLYAGALALVMPSRAEGYGFPPLEAAACGTPSVLSDLPALRETLDDAALFVPTGDESALAEALTRIARDAPLRDRLAAAAAGRAAQRTWEAAARRAHAVLREAAG